MQLKLPTIKPRLLVILLLVLTFTLVGSGYTYYLWVTAPPNGTIRITSAPTAISENVNDKPNIDVHAEWSHISKLPINILLSVSNEYKSADINTYSYNAECQSGCQSNLTNGMVDATFILTASVLEPGYEFYFYPSSMTIIALLCDQSTNCLAASPPVTIQIQSSVP